MGPGYLSGAHDGTRTREPRPYQGSALPTELRGRWWRGEDSNLRRRCQQIYSLPPLAAREPLRQMSDVGSLIWSREAPSALRTLNRSRSPVTKSTIQNPWSRRSESNGQPTDYKSVALPLSYAGLSSRLAVASLISAGKISPH